MLILLPGIQAGPAEFARLVPLLRREHLVLPLPDSTADRLPDIAAQLDLPAGEHDFLCASFGGLLAWALPRGRVRSLVTIGTLPSRTEAAERSGRAGRWLHRVPGPLFRRWYRDRVRASLEEDSADPELVASVRLPSPAVLAARLRAIGHWGLTARPPAPATWLWGVTDRFVTWDKGSVAALGMVPEILPGGHRPHLSHPSLVAAYTGLQGPTRCRRLRVKT
ncbi:MAG: alpha/beta fold hydrolase [Deltaproteobacteria bacterium]|nr:alpha/beta fold hydrolase [Deltaproteobacteria bacterium]